MVCYAIYHNITTYYDIQYYNYYTMIYYVIILYSIMPIRGFIAPQPLQESDLVPLSRRFYYSRVWVGEAALS